MSTAVFWAITQWVVVIGCLSFGTTYSDIGSRIQEGLNKKN